MKRTFTAEELTARWEDLREIENLMGRRTFYGILGRQGRIWREFWCRKAPAPCLGVNGGYYLGYEAIEALFEARGRYQQLQAELMKRAFPEKLGGKSAEELTGVGELVCENVSTPLIELAGDGQTAKGMWYVLGTAMEIGPSGPESHHSWGRVGVDFVKEDGAWKIWHLVFAEDLWGATGANWGVPQPETPADPRFAALADFEFPAPNVSVTLHERYHETRRLAAFPRLPEPYETFSETFSYGAGEEAEA